MQERGYERAVTSALTPAEERLFVASGYTVRERLHLLHHDLRDPGEVSAPDRLFRAKRTETEEILTVDNAAFGEFWKLDHTGLQDAISATPTARVRTAKVQVDGRSRIVGYAVTGRAGSNGYLQRLAVHPSQQGAGIGRDLVVDSLRWVRRRGGSRVLVNTQEANDRALGLYTDMGFAPESHGLAVLECDLVGS